MPAFNVCTYSLWARYCQYSQRAYIITTQPTVVQQVLECNRGRAVQLVQLCSRNLIEAEQCRWKSRACSTALPLLNLSSTFSTKTIRKMWSNHLTHWIKCYRWCDSEALHLPWGQCYPLADSERKPYFMWKCVPVHSDRWLGRCRKG